VLDMVGVEVRDERSSEIRMEEKLERAGRGGALVSNADRISWITEYRLRMSLWMDRICFEF
jgi:hypothetical protein